MYFFFLWCRIYNDAHIWTINVTNWKIIFYLILWRVVANRSESYLEEKERKKIIQKEISKSINNVYYEMDNFDSNGDKRLLRGSHKMR